MPMDDIIVSNITEHIHVGTPRYKCTSSPLIQFHVIILQPAECNILYLHDLPALFNGKTSLAKSQIDFISHLSLPT